MTATRHDSLQGRAGGPAFSIGYAASHAGSGQTASHRPAGAAPACVIEAGGAAIDDAAVFNSGHGAPRLLIVPGLYDSGPAHWQSRWQARWPQAGRVVQRDWGDPQLGEWAAQVAAALSQSSAPTVIIAHSFGCLATLHATAPSNVLGALLVAPASPDKFGIADALASVRPSFVTRVVASRDDPWMAFEDARRWAALWGSSFADAGALGHINADSALGDWEYGLGQLRQLLLAIGLDQALAP